MRVHALLVRGLVACALLLLSSCGSGKPDIDETEFLAAINFTAPISVSVQLNQFYDYYGRVQNTDNTNLIAFLANAGFIGAVAQTNSAPWWHFNVAGGSLANEQFTILVGKRVVTNHSDEKSWSEGAIKYYAETITYTIQLADGIKSATSAHFDQNSFRLVLMNDPAVGRWQAVVGGGRGTTFDGSDTATVVKELASEGNGYLNNFLQKIADAKTQSSDQIQASLASQHTLEVGPLPRTLLNKRAGILFYKGEAFNLANNVTLGTLKNYCSQLHAGNYSWTLPTDAQLSIVMQRNSYNPANIIDTPDGRLWGDVARPTVPGTVILTADAAITFTYSADSHAFYIVAYEMDAVSLSSNASFSRNSIIRTGADIDSTPIGQIGMPITGAGLGTARAICVAAITNTQ